MSVEVGTKVWARKGGGDHSDDWIAAEILNSVEGASTLTLTLRDEDTQVESTVSVPKGESFASDLKDVKIRNVDGQSAVSEGAAVEDLISLTHLHEPSIVFTLKERYAANAIYTYTGGILIAINPFFRIPLYSDELVATYQAEGKGKVSDPEHSSSHPPLPPHAYAIADNAYNAMAFPKSKGGGLNQSVLVSGESGAGKTETTKIIMQYLATVAGTAPPSTLSSLPSSPSGVGCGASRRDRNSRRRSGGGKDGVAVTAAAIVKEPLEKQVVQSNPILEAFGNARTVRNDNSSRFGKFIEIQFDASAHLAGAQVRTFLLEKVRLVRQSEGERNFHVFYQLTASAGNGEEDEEDDITDGNGHDAGNDSAGNTGNSDHGGTQQQQQQHCGPKEDKRWRRHLKTAQDYLYTSQSGCFDRRDGVQDEEEYDVLRDAFEVMRFSPYDIGGALSTAAAVLSLGEVEFNQKEDAETTGGFYAVMIGGGGEEEGAEAEDDPNDPAAVGAKAAAEMLEIDVESLANALTTRSIKVGHETFRKKLSPLEAEEARDGLAKATYSALFDWVVLSVNQAIQVAPGAPAAASFIGLLDIFGFESFQHNGFEQFLINYCNEVLQQQFNQFVFEAEQEEYVKEQILWSFVSFPDNKKCIDMIESKGSKGGGGGSGGVSSGSALGILSLLDEQSVFPNATDVSFSGKLHDTVAKTHKQHFGSTPELRASACFVVHHYAGSIRYDTRGFLERNKDKLYPEGAALLQGSFSPFIQRLLEVSSGGGACGGGGGMAAGACAGAGSGGVDGGGAGAAPPSSVKGGGRQRRGTIQVASAASSSSSGGVVAFPGLSPSPMSGGSGGFGVSAGGGGGGGRQRRNSLGGGGVGGLASPNGGVGGGGGGGGGGQLSTCSQFRESLRELVAQISLTTPHYVRCLKPNDSHSPHAFDNKRIVEQLRCGGVLEAVHVSRAGFPVRMKHKEFISRYALLAPSALKAALGLGGKKGMSSSASHASTTGAHELASGTRPVPPPPPPSILALSSSSSLSESQKQRLGAKAILDKSMVPSLLVTFLQKTPPSSSSSSSGISKAPTPSPAISATRPKKRGSMSKLFGDIDGEKAPAPPPLPPPPASKSTPSTATITPAPLGLATAAAATAAATLGTLVDPSSLEEGEWKVLLASAGLQLGTSKVFFRQRAFNAAEALRAQASAKAATRIQASHRASKWRKWFLAQRACALKGQTTWRRYRAVVKVHFLRQLRAATKVQARVRLWLALKKFQRLRKGVVALQASQRAKPLREKFVAYRRGAAAVVLQAHGRRFLASRRHFRVTLLVTLVAAKWRGKIGRLKARKAKREQRAAGALRQQVSAFQSMMSEAESLRRSVEKRAEEALAVAAAAEAETAELRRHNLSLRTLLEESCTAEAQATQELGSLQASHEILMEEKHELQLSASLGGGKLDQVAAGAEEESVAAAVSAALATAEESMRLELEEALASALKESEVTLQASVAEARREAIQEARLEAQAEAQQTKGAVGEDRGNGEKDSSVEDVPALEAVVKADHRAREEMDNVELELAAAQEIIAAQKRALSRAEEEVQALTEKSKARDGAAESGVGAGSSGEERGKGGTPKFKVGDKVLALYGGAEHNWFPGVVDEVTTTTDDDDTDSGCAVAAVSKDKGEEEVAGVVRYMYVVSYDDGDCEAGVPEHEIRMRSGPSSLALSLSSSRGGAHEGLSEKGGGGEIDQAHGEHEEEEGSLLWEQRALAAEGRAEVHKRASAQAKEDLEGVRAEAAELAEQLSKAKDEVREARLALSEAVAASPSVASLAEVEERADGAWSTQANEELAAANQALQKQIGALQVKVAAAAEDSEAARKQRLLREVEEEEEEEGGEGNEEGNGLGEDDDTLSDLRRASVSDRNNGGRDGGGGQKQRLGRSRSSLDRVAEGLAQALAPMAHSQEQRASDNFITTPSSSSSFLGCANDSGSGGCGGSGSVGGEAGGGAVGGGSPWSSSHTMRGMPTAKCHICGRRIPLDEIDEHGERCGTQVPDQFDPSKGILTGTTSAAMLAQGTSLVVTVLPSQKTKEAFKVSIVSGLEMTTPSDGHGSRGGRGDVGSGGDVVNGDGADGYRAPRSAQHALAGRGERLEEGVESIVVETSAARIVSLHEEIYRELKVSNASDNEEEDEEEEEDKDEIDDDDGDETSAIPSTYTAGTLSGAAADAASILGGFSAGFTGLAFRSSTSNFSVVSNGSQQQEALPLKKKKKKHDRAKAKEAKSKSSHQQELEQLAEQLRWAAKGGKANRPQHALPDLPPLLLGAVMKKKKKKENKKTTTKMPLKSEIDDAGAVAGWEDVAMCRALELFFISLLELDKEWIKLGKKTAETAGVSDGSGVDTASRFVGAHQLLMAFLDDNGGHLLPSS